jgi:hypothetical protein
MTPRNFRVLFFKKGEEKDELLGTVEVSDYGTSRNFTLLAKAFRQAAPICLLSDRTRIERI